MLENEKLLISPLACVRGRSLQRIFFIVDEARNLTPHEVKTIITRAAEGTKIVFTGDIHQIDHPFLDSLSNGLSYLINRMVDQSVFSHIRRSADSAVPSPMPRAAGIAGARDWVRGKFSSAARLTLEKGERSLLADLATELL